MRTQTREFSLFINQPPLLRKGSGCAVTRSGLSEQSTPNPPVVNPQNPRRRGSGHGSAQHDMVWTFPGGDVLNRFVLICSLILTGALAQDRQYTSWRDYAGSADSAQYSGLRQVNRSNVNQLQVAWTYPTGDGRKYFFNPIVIDELMYVMGKNNSIVALNAATGKEIWNYSPGPETRVIT